MDDFKDSVSAAGPFFLVDARRLQKARFVMAAEWEKMSLETDRSSSSIIGRGGGIQVFRRCAN